MLIGSYNKTVLITYIGIILSIVGMVQAIKGAIQYSLICLIAAGICDLFDGRFAAIFKRNEYEKSFGVEIDSLGDMINFAAFPIVLFYMAGLNAWWHIPLFGFYSLAAITRLAHFNVMAKTASETERPSFFQGLPVTYSALIFPLVWLISSWLMPDLRDMLCSLAFLCVGVLFVLDVKIPKPRGAAYIFFAVLAVLVSYFILTFRGAVS
ncbi:CDP-alcohol phosphatidyltransferase family protein [Enterococcus sp. LJL51]|uniref:CDP-alcohol phosphatidyltransferase family protein n=1 Tax=Enterococcus sp. LJL51 TaxID=3416656 RepID=UPI003CEC0988